MLALPCATPVAIPELLIVTTEVVLEAQLTEEVQFELEPSEYPQVAAYCCVPRACNTTDDGVTVMLCMLGALEFPIVILPVPPLEKLRTPAESVVALAGAPDPEIA